ncbi:hypothetical protein NKG99_07535 [Mesorhizobium sp. M1409]|uniref:hypothetical protein n=1 Tax=unclassified Mesorhizobium TaxID=325217 RepID=UPI00333DE4F9
MAWNEIPGARRVSGGSTDTVYHAYEIWLTDWAAGDGERMAALERNVCSYVARDVLDDLDAA